MGEGPGERARRFKLPHIGKQNLAALSPNPSPARGRGEQDTAAVYSPYCRSPSRSSTSITP